jgi:nucleolar protein 12
MLPRKLRVTRAKDPRKTTQAIERSKAKALNTDSSSKRNSNSVYNPKMTPEQKSAAGRAKKLFGRKQSGANTLPIGIKAPEKVVFEGRRASARDALPKDLKAKKKNKAKKGRPTNRGARRASAWQKKTAA